MVRKNKKVQKSVLVREEVLPSSSNKDDEEDVVSETEELNTKRPVTSVETNESKGVVIETSIPSTTNVPAIPVLVHPVNLAVTGNMGISSSVASLPIIGNIATTKPRVTMTKKEIKIWKASYTENDLTSFFEGMTHDFNQRPFWNTLAQLMIKSSSEETFSEANGKLYRWEARFNLDLDDGKSMSPQSLFDLIKKNVDEEKKEREKLKVSMILPHGFRFFLQLNDGNTNSKWYDWIYLAKSDIQNAGIGLFAGRAFPKNGIVGFYVGEEIWRATEPGTEEATQEYLASIGVKEDFYCLHTRDKTGTIRLLKPKPFNSEERNHLYMGMHFLNNACFMFINGSKKYRSAMKDNNCKLVCDGSIVTVKKIEKDSELLSAYSEQEIKCASANQSPNLKRKHAPEVAINKKK